MDFKEWWENHAPKQTMVAIAIELGALNGHEPNPDDGSTIDWSVLDAARDLAQAAFEATSNSSYWRIRCELAESAHAQAVTKLERINAILHSVERE